jgi:hypothetical protein
MCDKRKECLTFRKLKTWLFRISAVWKMLAFQLFKLKPVIKKEILADSLHRILQFCCITGISGNSVNNEVHEMMTKQG